MKHSLEFDLNNPLDLAKFNLTGNMMFIMQTIHNHLAQLHQIIDSGPVPQSLQDLLTDTEITLSEALNEFEYVAADGVCDACIAETKKKGKKKLKVVK